MSCLRSSPTAAPAATACPAAKKSSRPTTPPGCGPMTSMCSGARSTPPTPTPARCGAPAPNLIQGYNAQVLAGVGQVILAADLTQFLVDCTELAPMLARAGEELRAAVVDEPVGLLADGDYWSVPQIAAIRAQGHRGGDPPLATRAEWLRAGSPPSRGPRRSK